MIDRSQAGGVGCDERTVTAQQRRSQNVALESLSSLFTDTTLPMPGPNAPYLQRTTVPFCSPEISLHTSRPSKTRVAVRCCASHDGRSTPLRRFQRAAPSARRVSGAAHDPPILENVRATAGAGSAAIVVRCAASALGPCAVGRLSQPAAHRRALPGLRLLV